MPARRRNFCCRIIPWLVLLITTPGIPACVSPATDSLRTLAASRGFWIGAGDIHILPLSADAQYAGCGHEVCGGSAGRRSIHV
jgi:hypothetical protein